MKAQALEHKLSIKTHHESYEKDFVIILNSYEEKKNSLLQFSFSLPFSQTRYFV